MAAKALSKTHRKPWGCKVVFCRYGHGHSLPMDKVLHASPRMRSYLGSISRLQLKSYLSNLKWLTISFNALVKEVENWVEVLVYFISPIHVSPLTIRLRNGDHLTVPENYIFEAIAETLLLNVYDLGQLSAGAIVVDIGASVGDFALLASRSPDSRVYAFEPSPNTYRYMQSNLASNARIGVRLFNAPANGHTVDSILNTYGESKIDFLKIDCEGCEYKVLLECSQASLNKVARVAIEIHPITGTAETQLISALKHAGFSVTEWKGRGHGRYVFATRGTK